MLEVVSKIDGNDKSNQMGVWSESKWCMGRYPARMVEMPGEANTPSMIEWPLVYVCGDCR